MRIFVIYGTLSVSCKRVASVLSPLASNSCGRSHMITHPKKAILVDDEEASNSRNTSQTDDKVANMVYQRKQNLHFTMPVIKNTID